MKFQKTHGHTINRTATRTYKSWIQMRQRCTNPHAANFKDYGGRGIRVCHRWETFQNFLSDMGERPVGLTLDRIDNDKNYNKKNCRWSDMKQQERNRRNNRRISFEGQTLTISEWSEKLGLEYHVLHYRLLAGWPVCKILKQQPRKYRKLHAQHQPNQEI